MSDQIEEWLKRLDEILEHQQFETAAEAEAWIRGHADNRSVDEFLADCAPPHARIARVWKSAESAMNPAEAEDRYREVLRLGQEFFAADIAAARHDPALWQVEPARYHMQALFGLAACAEMQSQFDEAEEQYRAVLDLDPRDPLGAHEKIFGLCVMDGRLRDARTMLDAFAGASDSLHGYHRALLRFLEAADEAEQRYQQSGDIEAAASWHDNAANELLEKALDQNCHVARLMAHPRALELDCPAEAAPGSPAEAIMILYASAHLWLSDFLALSWLLGGLKNHRSRTSGHEVEWQQVLLLLGGEATDEERLEYLRNLEESLG